MVRKSFKSIVTTSNRSNYLSEKWFDKIKAFQVLVVYDDDSFTNNLYENFHKDVYMDMEVTDIFESNADSDTFVICQQTYQQNKKLFLKLRINARNELILRMAKVIIIYLLKRYKAKSSITLTNQPQFKDTQFIHSLVKQIEVMLKEQTFLADNKVWDEFCEWLNVYLSDWVLQDMENSLGIIALEKMSEEEIKSLFNKYIAKNISGDSRFMANFRKIVNGYVQQWITKIISELHLDKMPLHRIEELLQLEKPVVHEKPKDITMTVLQDGNLQVMSNPVYQSIRESLSNCTFKRTDKVDWPTSLLNKGTMKGTIQIKPAQLQNNRAKEEEIIKSSWNQVKRLSEVDVDVYDALCSIFLAKAKHHKDIVEFYMKDLLIMRGVKAKLGGKGRRGGFEVKQRNQILQALSIMQNLWAEIENVTLYEKGKSVQASLQGRVYLFQDENQKEIDISKHSFNKPCYFSLGEVLSKFLIGSGRQTAILPLHTLQYHPYQEKWEKKLIRYLSWRWRTQARSGAYMQPHKINTLLEVLGIHINKRAPSRTRERLEKAFDRLLEDGVITSWQYEKWDEDIASMKGWARIWEYSTVVIKPPLSIRDQYSSIERKGKNKFKASANANKVNNALGARIKYYRNRLGLTLIQAAEEIEISTSYLSNIERGIKIPSARVGTRIEKWVQLHENSI
ncbi:helix-turn-helix transcriptional regulator [Virgibacillus halodenitrificans]|uniref:helix-turn-helix domain-containing protein n=1 Tax=Virgibacillus halodenitrificans TaxID=1482 RepID=UPI0024BF9E4A|nr:helix-turn-helix transcriptional regulator [Virgibacillus halodenitrificans]WHX26923.1 helix-turn-helix transcriptional regulator [Virgibacillus halodenitrificans]